MSDPIPFDALENTAHVIQVALTPVFLLSGIGTLLNVFSTRLGRVADKVQHVSDLIDTAEPAEHARLRAQLEFLRRRSHALDTAVVLAAIAGWLTCGATLTLFLGALRDAGVASLLYLTFGLALLFTLMSLAAFVVEMTLASRGIRNQLARLPTAAAQTAADTGRSPEPSG